MTVRFGLVGTNWITDRLLAAAQEAEGFEAVAVCSRSKERAEAYAARHGIARAYDDMEAMAASGLIDAVYVATPNAYHAEQSILFMRHGIHVLCEKPAASNGAEARRMIEEARRCGVLLMEAMKPTFIPSFRAIERALPSIGKVRRYVGNFGQYSSRYDAYRAGTVLNAFDPALSNGALMDLGVYCLYPAIYWFGKPLEVKASGLVLESGADGEGTVLLRYADMEAVAMYSKITNSYAPSEIQGEDGSILIDKISQPGRVSIRYHDGREEEISVPQSEHTMVYELQAFVNLVREGRTESDINTHERMLAVLDVVDEARRQIGVAYPADRAEAAGATGSEYTGITTK
ncbi:Gfo/Idh/MocA family protein [Cohnella sp. JJ-181]|uniref:Gfo/Idh/MocA family protein n=1 Tax=Cohnella rhizoplanae TaxID=2974897 RepID=UPI0022FF9D69|nr:Gfo/Idh/MocA family oxidoreductase [Cohnella sp. JJ-181]CAI6053673.1 scyllo-inositol 2-dehydrogenase (NADP(+)) IolU [Cohnella sp. JJ-181]